MRVIVKSHWHPNSNGSEYTRALGIYDTLEAAFKDATAYAWEQYEEPSEEEQEEDGIEDEGPDVIVEEYKPGEDGHDSEREGGGSFEDEFLQMEIEAEVFNGYN